MKCWPCISTKETAEKTKKSSRNLPITSKYHSEEYLLSYRDITLALSMSNESPKKLSKNYTVTVLVPQFIPNKPWQNIPQSNFKLNTLRWHEDVVVASYSYHLKDNKNSKSVTYIWFCFCMWPLNEPPWFSSEMTDFVDNAPLHKNKASRLWVPTTLFAEFVWLCSQNFCVLYDDSCQYATTVFSWHTVMNLVFARTTNFYLVDKYVSWWIPPHRFCTF